MYSHHRTLVILLVIALLATFGGVSFARRLDTQIQPKTLNLPASVVVGNQFQGTVVMDNTAASDTVVNLSENAGSAITIPATITVEQGSDRATFTGTANAAASVTITASANGGQVHKTMATTSGE